MSFSWSFTACAAVAGAIAATATATAGPLQPPSGFGVAARPPVGSVPLIPVSKRSKGEPAATDIPSDVGGRYAVMREKHDTGCMLTLDDKSRVKGGERAQLAPGCRDQGIVIFDPTAWKIVKGELILTARAGHTTRLRSAGVGGWQKDPKDGGKPLGLKKL